MADDLVKSARGYADTLDDVELRTRELERSAASFGRAMTSAFQQSVVGGRGFDDVLKSLALRMSGMAVGAAFKPLGEGFASGISQLFGGLFGGFSGSTQGLAAAMGAIKPFAAGGVVGTPTYFPLSGGGLGLTGEAGPEAILPLQRGADGRLGVAADSGGRPASIIVNIATSDAESFRRSESYITGQIARAVARGQRSL